MYIYSFNGKQKIVDAKNKNEARIKLNLSHIDSRNFMSIATEKEIKEHELSDSIIRLK